MRLDRINEPRELLAEMIGWEGKCVYCGSVVMMMRSMDTLELVPDECRCLLCGQAYYMVVPDLERFEQLQRAQRAEHTEGTSLH